ncbi:MAG: hypothetical protein ABI551_10455 [Polyangiaceae bacterium]
MNESPKLILVLGAGASFGARCELLEPTPPLGDRLASYLLKWLDANDPGRLSPLERMIAEDSLDASYPDPDIWRLGHLEEVNQLLAKIKREGGFEATLNELLEQPGSWGTLTDLNRIISVAFLGGEGCAFEPNADRYDELLKEIGSQLCAVITPNYDLLFEEALERAGTVFFLAGVEAEVGLPLFKIHGSVDWMQVKGHASSATLEVAVANSTPTRFVDQEGVGLSVETEVMYIPEGRKNLWLTLKDLQHKPPLLATYGRGKPSTHERVRLERVRDQARYFVEQHANANVVMIGLRPPEDDVDDPTWAALCREMAQTTGKKTYVSPVAVECDKMRTLGFRSVEATLEEFLKRDSS